MGEMGLGDRRDYLVRVMDMVWKANIHMSPSCPHCGSSNTKFCYYNKYSLTQPRYYCKGCKRYWTKEGSLRNVPVGGGCRKIRRCRSSRVSKAEAASSASLVNGFGSNSGSSISLEGSHIHIVLVYANYLNHKLEPKGELEMEAAGGGLDDQLMPNAKQADPNIELLCQNKLIECEFLSSFFTETQSNNKNQMYHKGLGRTNTNKEKIQGCDGIDADGYSLPLFPNEEVASWCLDSRTEMVMMNHIVFQESDFPPEVFGSQDHDHSFIIANCGDFDLTL